MFGKACGVVAGKANGILAGRAQGSLEFLLTYGWAIVLIGIVAGLLFFLGFKAGEVSFSSDNPVLAIEEAIVGEGGLVYVKARNVSSDGLEVVGFSLGKDFSDMGNSTLNGVGRKSISANNPASIFADSELLFENIVYAGLGSVKGEIIIHARTASGPPVDIILSGTGTTVPAAVSITSCKSPIDTPGNYALANDVSSRAGCLKIESDNVFLNCQGKTIDGGGVGNGVYLNGRKNVTLANCDVSNFDNGFHLENSSNCSVNNNSAKENKEIGFFLNSSSGTSVLDNLAEKNAKGFYLLSSQRNSLIGNVSSKNEYGFVLYSSSNNNFLSFNNSSNSNHDGLLIFNSSNNEISENVFCKNYLESGKDIECSGSSKSNQGKNNSAGIVSKVCELENTQSC